MKTIYKYELKGYIEESIDMPFGAEILSIQMQNDKPVLWALVDPTKTPIRRLFFVFGTGNTLLSDQVKFIGTYQDNGFVGHVFEYTGI